MPFSGSCCRRSSSAFPRARAAEPSSASGRSAGPAAEPRSGVGARRARPARRPPGLRHAPALLRQRQRRRAGAGRAVVRVERRARLDVSPPRGRLVPRRHAADGRARRREPGAADSARAPERAGGERRRRACSAACRASSGRSARPTDGPCRSRSFSRMRRCSPSSPIPSLSIALPSPAGRRESRRSRAPGPSPSPRSRRSASCWTRRPGHWAGGAKVGRVVFTATPDASQARGGARRPGPRSLLSRRRAAAPVRRGLRPGLARGLSRASDGEGSVQPGEGSRARWPPRSIRRRSRSPSAPPPSPSRDSCPPSVWARRDGAVILEGNPERAKKLLAEAGSRKPTPPDARRRGRRQAPRHGARGGGDPRPRSRRPTSP